MITQFSTKNILHFKRDHNSYWALHLHFKLSFMYEMIKVYCIIYNVLKFKNISVYIKITIYNYSIQTRQPIIYHKYYQISNLINLI